MPFTIMYIMYRAAIRKPKLPTNHQSGTQEELLCSQIKVKRVYIQLIFQE